MNYLKIISFLFLITVTSSYTCGQYFDWPMWRYDYNRSASTPENLADSLFLQWEIRFSPREPVWDDPLNQNLMQFDRIFEPIVTQNKIIIGFNDQDKVVALDLNTGQELWHYYADGPVRLPLVSNKGKIYFTSDDGFCYCLKSSDGSLVWKLLLAPGPNKLLGNKRMISMWPARGGIVIKDNVLYTAASIFPLMGTFIYAINADDGTVLWKNEGTGSNYILQPHNSPAFADVAPQGTFVISDNKLLVAGGRSVPAAFDTKTGEELYYHLASSGKTGGAFTCSNDKVFFNHHRGRMTFMYDTETGKKLLSNAGEYPVIDGNNFYFSGRRIVATSLNSEKGLDTLWISDTPATNDLIKAGNCLYAADSSGISAIKIDGIIPEVTWKYHSLINIDRLLASNGKLIAVSNDGTIQVFGNTPKQPSVLNATRISSFRNIAERTKKFLKLTDINEGYALIFGTSDIELLKGLISTTRLSLIAYERDLGRLNYLREYFDNMGINAGKLCFLPFEGKFPSLPKYFSSLTIINDINFLNSFDSETLNLIYQSSRPYNGKIIIRYSCWQKKHITKIVKEADLPDAEFSAADGFVILSRTGSISGTDSWTHNHGDISNTLKSDDKMVKAPLGILWFGGNSNMDVLPRHGHGPGEQVIDGKLIIEGISCISARDVYTGRVLWKREFPKLIDDSWLVYFDETYDEENPLDPKYNQVHIPGSNARGTNFIATKEFVYLIEGNKCNLLDINTGEHVKTLTTGDQNTLALGYIGVYEDLLILGSNFSDYPINDTDSIIITNPKFTRFNLSASQELVVLDRFSGKRLWNIKANHGFIHNSVIAGDGILFCLDKLPQYIETKMKRRGEDPPSGSRLIYLDIRSGNIIYQDTIDIFGTWLGYSSFHKILLQASRPSGDMLHGEEGRRMIAYNMITKEKIWDKEMVYANPPIIHSDKIYCNGNGWYLLTGEPIMEKDPVTGEDLKWSFKREYGCGIVAASEHLLTFRSASAGFVNLDVFEGTGSLGGWKASCSTNLIAADGVLNSPDYTRTCQCPYQNQTSLALINMPWMTYWTNSNYKWDGSRINKLGINLNAPGDRVSDKGVLWLEFPYAGGTISNIPVEWDTVKYFKIRKEPLSIISEATPWVTSSATGGIRSLTIPLSKKNDDIITSYQVSLYFSELENLHPGDRIFNIRIQNQTVAENFDIVSEAGKANKEIIKIFSGIKAGRSLKIELIPVKGNTILSGIELIQDVFSEQ